jgi:hypothetical protein
MGQMVTEAERVSLLVTEAEPLSIPSKPRHRWTNVVSNVSNVYDESRKSLFEKIWPSEGAQTED